MMPLNSREKEILKLVCDGNSYKEIAKMLDLSLPTIKVYIRSAKDKLGAVNGGHAIALFVQMRMN
jgi:DNA-binding CsgD family transcriptional regulator